MILILGNGTLANAINNRLSNCIIVSKADYDLSTQDGCDKVLSDFPSPDVVINTAAVMSDDIWSTLTINFVAPCYLTMQYFNQLSQGQIINISSASAWWPSYPNLDFNRFTYNISKLSLSNFCLHINRVCVDNNKDITITNIEPRKFQSSMNGYTGKSVDAIVDAIEFAILHKVQQISVIK